MMNRRTTTTRAEPASAAPYDSGMSHDIGLNRLTLSFALLAGGGVILMMIALAIGVINGESAGGVVPVLFLGGLLALIAGIAAWFGVVQPQANFDDINVPLYHGHEEHHALALVDEAHGGEQSGEVNVVEPVLPQTTAPTHAHH